MCESSYNFQQSGILDNMINEWPLGILTKLFSFGIAYNFQWKFVRNAILHELWGTYDRGIPHIVSNIFS